MFTIYDCSIILLCLGELWVNKYQLSWLVTTYAGLDETVQSGVRIKGPAGDEETNNAFIEALIDLLKNPEKQEPLRQEALALKDSFSWALVAQQWHQEFICAP